MENQELFNSRTDLSDLRNAVNQLRNEIAKMVVGQQQMVDLILSAILADGHVLIEGVPGVAKTLTAKIVARTISSAFSRIQFTPDMMPSDVLGTSIYNSKNSEFEFKKGPIFSNIVLIDEINRAPAKTQSALFEVMEERQITIDGKTYKMDSPFIVLATQNPVEQEGTYRLPEAQLDRFIYKIEINYPTLEDEEKILTGFHHRKSSNDLSIISPILSGAQIQQYREDINNLHIDQHLIRYISQLVNQTRNNSALYLGASPRASIAILRGAKAMAAMRGRDFVSPDDIVDVTYPVLGHRIMLTAEKEMEGVTAKDIIKEITTKVEVPR
ncbi:MAG TPA: MoxR family ATPase [Cytophagaceae bacterium]|jgi:MoxR-like ATPase|nr:MoxR family ATPase [Cytophagaceae bacterium]